MPIDPRFQLSCACAGCVHSQFVQWDLPRTDFQKDRREFFPIAAVNPDDTGWSELVRVGKVWCAAYDQCVPWPAHKIACHKRETLEDLAARRSLPDHKYADLGGSLSPGPAGRH